MTTTPADPPLPGIQMLETQQGPTDEGPWEPSLLSRATGIGEGHEWCVPFKAHRERPDPITTETIYEPVFVRHRLVEYVPLALLESERSEHATTREGMLTLMAKLDDPRICENCSEPAACVGAYEGGPWQYACDDCCGHGCEDGRCFQLADSDLDKAEKERDALAVKLEKAMAVVESAVRRGVTEAFCPLCEGGVPAHDGNPYEQHDDDCPLVAQGFIDRDGRRLETAGKEGA